MSSYQNLTGIIINISSRRAPDLTVTLLTKEQGKIITLAKGVKKIKSRRLGSLQLGNEVTAQIYNHQGFNWLTEIQSESQFLYHSKDLIQFNLLFYILEIVNFFIAENQHIDGVYHTLNQSIKAINQKNFPNLINSEINLLDLLGFGIPAEINKSFSKKNYSQTQKHIKNYLESILNRPLESNKLFR